MRKIIVSTYVTLDGVIQPIDWSMPSKERAHQEERGNYARDLLIEADALLLGRETYQIFAEVWPTRTTADDGPGEEGASDRINSMPKYVASRTLSEPLAWNATLLQGDVPQAVAKLKEQPGGSIVVYGCGELAKSLLDHGLVDEFRFWVFPSVRGQGTRLFQDEVNADMELVDTKVFGGGFVVMTCVPKRAT